MTARGSEDVDRVRPYLAALLPAAEVGPALEAAVDADDPLAAAREEVHARVRVTLEVEVDVLVHDAAVGIDRTAELLGLDEDEVRRVVAEAEAIAAELSGPSAPGRAPIVIVDDTGEPLDLPEDRSRRGRRLGWFVLAGLILAAVVAVLTVPDDGPRCAAEVRDVPEAPIDVTDACITDIVDRSGQPGAEQRQFEAGEIVRFWFAYDRRSDDEFLLTLIVVRDGEALSTRPQFALPSNCPGGSCDYAHVPIPETLVNEPADYRVQIRWEDEVLTSAGFTVVR